MILTHHNPPRIVQIAKEELRKTIITIVAPETVKRGINFLSILKFILITSMLVIHRNQGIENM